jgi:serine protease Do
MSAETNSLSGAGAEIAAVAERFGSAVVGVGRGWRVGSGFVVAPGSVLTAARHVDREATTVTLADGTRATADLHALDRDRGLALLSIDTGDAPALEFAEDFDGAIGTPVFALANPGGRGLRVTAGFVAAAPRDLRAPGGRRLSGAIEHTASLPKGSAGGPLLGADGKVAGINLLRGDGGLIVALGASGLREAASRLTRGESSERPVLGVAVAPPWVARKMRRAVGLPEREGLLVRGVEEGGPADRAGLARGDLIVAAAGAELDGLDALYRALEEAAKDGLELTVVRGSDERNVKVDLEARAAA